MDEIIQLIIKTYGIVGIILLIPLFGIGWVYKDNRKMSKEHDKDIKILTQTWEDRLERLHNQRVMDAQAITAKLVEIVSEQSGLNKETNLALSRISETMTHLDNSLLQLQNVILNMKNG